jgi:glutaredoxin 3
MMVTPIVKVYSTRWCGYCRHARRLLEARGIAYQEIDITGDDDQRRWLVETTGRRTVPQIFIRGAAIGGYEELAELDRKGELLRMIEGGAAA